MRAEFVFGVLTQTRSAFEAAGRALRIRVHPPFGLGDRSWQLCQAPRQVEQVRPTAVVRPPIYGIACSLPFVTDGFLADRKR